MNKSVYLLIFCFIIIGCTHEPKPVQVKDRLIFGNYSISPPKGYWYFPGKYPAKFSTQKDLFLITFWEDKAAASGKTPPDKLRVMFNFAVSQNNYKSLDAYYKVSESSGLKYDALPVEADMLKSTANWSCKQTNLSLYVIECNSLGENLVTLAVFGKNKSDVLAKMPEFKQMIDSVERVEMRDRAK
jgi:hypothetical protein